MSLGGLWSHSSFNNIESQFLSHHKSHNHISISSTLYFQLRGKEKIKKKKKLENLKIKNIFIIIIFFAQQVPLS